MASTSDIRNNAVILHRGKRMKVVEFQHVKPGKGGAFVRTKLKNIQSGKVIDETFNSGAKIELVRIEVRSMQYLYDENDTCVFMDNESYEQLTVDKTIIGEGRPFLYSGLMVELLFDGDEVLDCRLPPHVNLDVSKTEPGFRGNTATGATKPATLETGHSLNVPLFIEVGDKLKVDTRTGEYIERVKND
jgi:elongation factor P